MVTFIAGSKAEIPHDVFHALGRYRHDVFVKRLGWAVPAASDPEEVEWDEFDTNDTVHVAAQDGAGHVCGCARLLPTTKPYLMNMVLHAQIRDKFPCDPDVWELSRVTTSTVFKGADLQVGNVDRMKGLMNTVIEEARSRGAVRLIGFASSSMLRLYRRKGFRLVPEGRALMLDDHALQRFSLSIECARAIN
jgi:N-acyl-L-homoserine lactone synthetase